MTETDTSPEAPKVYTDSRAVASEINRLRWAAIEIDEGLVDTADMLEALAAERDELRARVRELEGETARLRVDGRTIEMMRLREVRQCVLAVEHADGAEERRYWRSRALAFAKDAGPTEARGETET